MNVLDLTTRDVLCALIANPFQPIENFPVFEGFEDATHATKALGFTFVLNADEEIFLLQDEGYCVAEYTVEWLTEQFIALGL